MPFSQEVRREGISLYSAMQPRHHRCGGGSHSKKLVSSSAARANVDESNNAPPSQECRLHLFDRNSNLKYLIDSGSTLSLVPKRYCTGRLTPTDFNLTAANGSTIKTYGQKVLSLHLALRREFRWVFIIADVRQAILGADFLSHYGLLIDLKGRCLADPLTRMAAQGTLHPAAVHTISAAYQVTHDEGPDSARYAELLRTYEDLALPKTMVIPDTISPVAHHIVTSGPPAFARPRRLTGDNLAAAK